ncbi:hypothetical protein L9F63_019501, partial [Diploptera punctata]
EERFLNFILQGGFGALSMFGPWFTSSRPLHELYLMSSFYLTLRRTREQGAYSPKAEPLITLITSIKCFDFCEYTGQEDVCLMSINCSMEKIYQGKWNPNMLADYCFFFVSRCYGRIPMTCHTFLTFILIFEAIFLMFFFRFLVMFVLISEVYMFYLFIRSSMPFHLLEGVPYSWNFLKNQTVTTSAFTSCY